MKNEGFRPSKYGSQPLKMKVVGSHGRRIFSLNKNFLLADVSP